MISILFSNARMLTQTPDNENEIAEPAIALSKDAAGLIVLCQEGREILVNRASVSDLLKMIKEAAK